ncbi:MAG: hypothetical protein KJ950_17630 [Proteobacteria bacterium]|nr:hypothetical protein [Pseudomonadota bacterium]MBU1689082.1 hypothetical protein [Pseudomonadota bacterium]
MTTNTKQDESIQTNSLFEFHEGAMQVVMGLIVASAAIVGLWGFISLFTGIGLGGGIIEMARGWMNAITGM